MGKDIIHRMITNYRAVAADLGRSPSKREYEESKLAKFSVEAFLELFKTWPAVIRAAGNTPSSPKKYQDPTEEPKILVVDLELLPMQVYTFGLYDQNIGVNQIIHGTSLASYAAQYVGSDEVIYEEVNWKKDPRADKALTKKLYAQMCKADIIVGQNSDSFDVRVANERFLTYDLGPTKMVKYLDTKKMGKRHFWFPSYGLEYMSSRFCKTKKMVAGRKFHKMELQIECLKKNAEAWAEMREYNIRDVLSTTELVKEFAPWASPNLNSMRPGAIFRCPNLFCGSVNIIHRGWRPGKMGRHKQYSCNDCGKWFSEEGAANNYLSPAKRASLRGKS